jgi:dynein heavy chain 1
VIIDYGKVQSKVSLKYDSWHKDALGKFGNLLGNEMSLFHSQVRTRRIVVKQLERVLRNS